MIVSYYKTNQCHLGKNTPLPDEFVPGDHDVICGRGKQSYNATGNRRFRATVASHMARYLNARSKLDKSLVVISIVDTFRAFKGGFVKKCTKTKKWLEIGDQLAREKVGHALRDAISAREAEGIDPTSVVPMDSISLDELMKLSTRGLENFEKQVKRSAAFSFGSPNSHHKANATRFAFSVLEPQQQVPSTMEQKSGAAKENNGSGSSKANKKKKNCYSTRLQTSLKAATPEGNEPLRSSSHMLTSEQSQAPAESCKKVSSTQGFFSIHEDERSMNNTTAAPLPPVVSDSLPTRQVSDVVVFGHCQQQLQQQHPVTTGEDMEEEQVCGFVDNKQHCYDSAASCSSGSSSSYCQEEHDEQDEENRILDAYIFDAFCCNDQSCEPSLIITTSSSPCCRDQRNDTTKKADLVAPANRHNQEPTPILDEDSSGCHSSNQEDDDDHTLDPLGLDECDNDEAFEHSFARFINETFFGSGAMRISSSDGTPGQTRRVSFNRSST